MAKDMRKELVQVQIDNNDTSSNVNDHCNRQPERKFSGKDEVKKNETILEIEPRNKIVNGIFNLPGLTMP